MCDTVFVCESPHPQIEYLEKLHAELCAKGVECEVIASDFAPRVQLHIPWLWHEPEAEFQDNVVVTSEPDGTWRFWWPWGQPIGPADDMAQAADHIYRNTAGSLIRDTDENDQAEQDPGECR